MKSNKKSLDIQKIIENVFSIFALSIIILIFIGLYFFAAFQGYLVGKTEAQKEFLSYFDENKRATQISPTPTATPSSQPRVVVSRRQVDWGGPELWEEVNNRRIELGVNPLQTREELCTIASIRLNELLELGKLDNHEGFSNMPERRPDLQWIFDRYSVVAEFLAVGGETPEHTVDLWENTLGHKKLLDGGEYVWGCIYAQNTFSVAITAF